MPPAAWISSSARSKPCFHCAPYCAFGPVNGPLTPNRIGSEDWAEAPRDSAPAIAAASDVLIRLRRSILHAMLLMAAHSMIEKPVHLIGNFRASKDIPRDTKTHYHAGLFVAGSPSDSISRLAQLKNAALLMTSTISASSRPTRCSSSMFSWPNAMGVEASATEARTMAFQRAPRSAPTPSSSSR